MFHCHMLPYCLKLTFNFKQKKNAQSFLNVLTNLLLFYVIKISNCDLNFSSKCRFEKVKKVSMKFVKYNWVVK